MSLTARHDQAAVRRRSRYPRNAAAAVVGALLACGSSFLAFWLHFSFATVISLQLLLVVVAALRGSFALATAASLAGFFCLNYLFVAPLFQFTVADPRNWVSLIAFEATALLVSSLSSKAREHAAEAQLQRARSVKLYELSRAILLIDGSRSVVEQLRSLIQEIIQVDRTDLWILYDDLPCASPSVPISDPDGGAYAYGRGVDCDDPPRHFSQRMLHIGAGMIGAMTLKGWAVDELIADGVASLAAVAVERARAVRHETKAASERDSEALRTVVLDGLAHGFKTPLTAIQTASSGLLAIGELNPTQTELVTIVNDQASTLNRMATRLLQTAALDRHEIKLRKAPLLLQGLVRQLVLEQDEAVRARILVLFPPDLSPIHADAQLVEQALLQLIDNALKYSDASTPVSICATQTDGCTCVSVENFGSAIQPQEQERIFERFYRGSAETRHSQPGTGLGLSIVRKTAVAHQGQAWVESERGKTTFFFTLGKGIK